MEPWGKWGRGVVVEGRGVERGRGENEGWSADLVMCVCVCFMRFVILSWYKV
jgi:hypothetical protein